MAANFIGTPSYIRGHHSDILMARNGWHTNANSIPVNKYSYTVTIPDLIMSQWPSTDSNELYELKLKEAITKLSQEMLSGGYMYVNNSLDPVTLETRITVNCNAVLPGNAYVHRKDEAFVVDGIQFSDDELVEAIRQQYPEKFI